MNAAGIEVPGKMNAVSMPMYDIPEVRKALDDLWCGLSHGLRREGIVNVPDNLLHGVALNVLLDDPMLFFSQCCGYDLVNRYAGKLLPLATPHYGAEGCEGSEYASVVVVAEDVPETDVLHMSGAVCVVNGTESHSGMNALRALIAPASRDGRFFSQVRISGGHAASLEMLRNREADVASIDCVTYALLGSYRPEALAGTRMLGWTARAPAIPYVTRSDADDDTVARMRCALQDIFDSPDFSTTRQALYLKSLEVLPVQVYEEITGLQAFAARAGYSVLQ